MKSPSQTRYDVSKIFRCEDFEAIRRQIEPLDRATQEKEDSIQEEIGSKYQGFLLATAQVGQLKAQLSNLLAHLQETSKISSSPAETPQEEEVLEEMFPLFRETPELTRLEKMETLLLEGLVPGLSEYKELLNSVDLSWSEFHTQIAAAQRQGIASLYTAQPSELGDILQNLIIREDSFQQVLPAYSQDPQETPDKTYPELLKFGEHLLETQGFHFLMTLLQDLGACNQRIRGSWVTRFTRDLVRSFVSRCGKALSVSLLDVNQKTFLLPTRTLRGSSPLVQDLEKALASLASLEDPGLRRLGGQLLEVEISQILSQMGTSGPWSTQKLGKLEVLEKELAHLAVVCDRYKMAAGKTLKIQSLRVRQCILSTYLES